MRPEELTGALAPLRDEQFFSQVFIEYGAVAWSSEIDLAPDAMYAQIAGQSDGLQHPPRQGATLNANDSSGDDSAAVGGRMCRRSPGASPSGAFFVQYTSCSVQNPCTPEVVITNRDGTELHRFEVRNEIG